MKGPLRFAPPTGRGDALLRARLLGRLGERWDRRVTVLLGGAGFGKTTVLAQMMAENQLDPVGDQIWIGVDRRDGDGDLAVDLLSALTGQSVREVPSSTAILDAVWQRAPRPVCLVLDDVHVLDPGSGDHQMLVELVAGLPANGHIVLAAREDPSIGTARLIAAGDLVRIGEDELRFDDEELAELARLRAVASEDLADASGWPAIAELIATVGRTVARDYLWQEVIQPLGPERRRVLATLVELGGGDDELLSAALLTPIELEEALRGVPLIATSDDGWHRPHPLWRPMARLRLTGDEKLAVRHRAANHLCARARFDEAFELLAASGQWEGVSEVLRASCGGLRWHPPAHQLRRWLGALPPELPRSGAVALAVGVLAVLDDPDRAVPPLRTALGDLGAAGDVEGELVAITHLGRVAWWTGDLSVLGEIAPRVAELAEDGHDVARSLDAIGRAIIADLAGDDDAMIEAVQIADQSVLGASWAPIIDWIRSIACYCRGDMEAASTISLAALDVVDDDDTYRDTLWGIHVAAAWRWRGDPTVLLNQPGTRRVGPPTTGVSHNRTVHAAAASLQCSHIGDVDSARELLETARLGPMGDRAIASMRVTAAEASLLLADGDEHEAAEVLRRALAIHALTGPVRRVWREILVTTYVLVPETRETWDTLPLRGFWARSRTHAAGLAGLREGRLDPTWLGDTDVSTLGCHLHHCFAAEVAVALADAGAPAALALLESAGASGRAHLRSVSATNGSTARSAKRLLAAVPAVPTERVELGVLGPLVVRHNGAASVAPELRRERVRALACYLALRRSVRRDQIIDAVWPDHDQRSGADNLRVTLTHLHHLLEPGRADGDPPFFVRTEGEALYLASTSQLEIDLDRFETATRAAQRAEHDGIPSLALRHNLEAVDLWRGDLGADVDDAPWLDLPRFEARDRVIQALRRSAELQLGAGALDEAEALARRGVELDEWNEDIHAALVGVALARGDRASAVRALKRAYEAVAELGVRPGPGLQHLADKLG